MVERSFRIQDAQYSELKGISEKEGIPITQLVRMAIKAFLDAYANNIELAQYLIDTN